MTGSRRDGAGRFGRGAAVAVATLLAATLALVPLRGGLSLAAVVLLYLVPVLLTAAVGGLWPARSRPIWITLPAAT